jgi:hypothetical protein
LIDSKNSDDFQEFKSSNVPAGVHLFDVALLSDFQSEDSTYESKAQVLISRATFEGTAHGGAQ